MIGFSQVKPAVAPALARKQARNRPALLKQEEYEAATRECGKWFRELGSSADQK